MNNKIYRSKSDRKVSGVCGGFAVYSNMDVTIIRLIWAISTFVTGGVMGVIIYFICVLIIPEEPDYYDAEFKEK